MAGRAEGAPDLGHALHQAVVGDRNAGPDRADKLVLADDPPGVQGEMPQDREGLRARTHLDPVGPDHELPVEVDPEAADLQRVRHLPAASRPRRFPSALRGKFRRNFGGRASRLQDAGGVEGDYSGDPRGRIGMGEGTREMIHMTPLELRMVLKDLEDRATAAATGLDPSGCVVGPWHMVRWLKDAVNRRSRARPSMPARPAATGA